MFALLIDIEKRQPGFIGGVHIASAGNHQVGLIAIDHIQQRAGVALFQHYRLFAHQLADPLFILFGGFTRTGCHHGHAQILQRRDHRPGFHPAGIEQRFAAAQPFAPRL